MLLCHSSGHFQDLVEGTCQVLHSNFSYIGTSPPLPVCCQVLLLFHFSSSLALSLLFLVLSLGPQCLLFLVANVVFLVGSLHEFLEIPLPAVQDLVIFCITIPFSSLRTS